MSNIKKINIMLVIFMIISVISIYMASGITYAIKQFIWYLIGFLIIFLTRHINKKLVNNNIAYLYIIFNVLLLLLLFFAPTINNAKCWFNFGFFSFQPSEFMKIILIIYESIIISQNKYMKFFVVLLIPSILTFLEPDTGAVIFYIVISSFILFTKGVKLKYFGITAAILLISLLLINNIYILDNDIFPSSIGVRLDRIINWKDSSGFQLESSLSAIGSASILGHGFNKLPIYLPEANTDFIFATYSSCFGFIGSTILIILFIYFDILILNIGRKKDNVSKYIISGFLGMLLYGQIQNIAMTIGALPITGITLPFISYGGSSLLSYFLMISYINNL